jgi:hypothetical protein
LSNKAINARGLARVYKNIFFYSKNAYHCSVEAGINLVIEIISTPPSNLFTILKKLNHLILNTTNGK